MPVDHTCDDGVRVSPRIGYILNLHKEHIQASRWMNKLGTNARSSYMPCYSTSQISQFELHISQIFDLTYTDTRFCKHATCTGHMSSVVSISSRFPWHIVSTHFNQKVKRNVDFRIINFRENIRRRIHSQSVGITTYMTSKDEYVEGEFVFLSLLHDWLCDLLHPHSN